MTQLIMTPANYLQSAIFEVMASMKELNNKRLARKAYKDTYRQLSNMADKDLRDIGICRGDIAAVAAGKDVRKGTI